MIQPLAQTKQIEGARKKQRALACTGVCAMSWGARAGASPTEEFSTITADVYDDVKE